MNTVAVNTRAERRAESLAPLTMRSVTDDEANEEGVPVEVSEQEEQTDEAHALVMEDDQRSERGIEDGNLEEAEERQTLTCRERNQNGDEEEQRKSAVSQVGQPGKQRDKGWRRRTEPKGSDDEDPDWMRERKSRHKKKGVGRGKQLKYGRDEVCTICDKVLGIGYIAKHVASTHRQEDQPQGDQTPVRKCVRAQIQVRDGEKITMRINGVWKDLRVIRPWGKDSENFYNYYDLELLDSEDRVRINLEEQEWTRTKENEPDGRTMEVQEGERTNEGSQQRESILPILDGGSSHAQTEHPSLTTTARMRNAEGNKKEATTGTSGHEGQTEDAGNSRQIPASTKGKDMKGEKQTSKTPRQKAMRWRGDKETDGKNQVLNNHNHK